MSNILVRLADYAGHVVEADGHRDHTDAVLVHYGDAGQGPI